MRDKNLINLPQIVSEVRQAFLRYEQALMSNDVAVLDELFLNDPTTIRYGATENLYGHAEIRKFRSQRPAKGLNRSIYNTVITTFGEDFAVAHTEFKREGVPKTGRQSQTWMRTPQGWRIVAAHVSYMEQT